MDNTQTNHEFSEMVTRLAKPGEDILKTLTAEKADLLHMALGVATEAGELLDAVKRNVIYNKPLDHANVVEELGDLMFYVQGIQNNLVITRSEILKANMTKLSKRYAEAKYSDEQANARADKNAD